LGIEISPAKIQQLEDMLFYCSFLIIIVWSLTTNVIIEYGEVEYRTPNKIVPVIVLFDVIQFSITLIYSIMYYKCKFALANYRAKKKLKQ
jgi:hypothetical protein